MEKIITLGEIMLRLSTPDYSTINQTHSFMVNYGGGEANVAVALSHMGHNTYFISKLPPNQLGDGAVTHLRSHGVNTKYVVRGSSTIGIYFWKPASAEDRRKSFTTENTRLLPESKKMNSTGRKSLKGRLGFI